MVNIGKVKYFWLRLGLFQRFGVIVWLWVGKGSAQLRISYNITYKINNSGLRPNEMQNTFSRTRGISAVTLTVYGEYKPCFCENEEWRCVSHVITGSRLGKGKQQTYRQKLREANCKNEFRRFRNCHWLYDNDQMFAGRAKKTSNCYWRLDPSYECHFNCHKSDTVGGQKSRTRQIVRGKINTK